jgi:hypothetical protein
VALTLLALALGVSLAPREVPGLTVPGSPAAAKAMSRMSGNPQSMGHEAMPMKHK